MKKTIEIMRVFFKCNVMKFLKKCVDENNDDNRI